MRLEAIAGQVPTIAMRERVTPALAVSADWLNWWLSSVARRLNSRRCGQCRSGEQFGIMSSESRLQHDQSIFQFLYLGFKRLVAWKSTGITLEASIFGTCQHYAEHFPPISGKNLSFGLLKSSFFYST
jgi:hypothetical protein